MRVLLALLVAAQNPVVPPSPSATSDTALEAPGDERVHRAGAGR
jgi:hypothetical protein